MFQELKKPAVKYDVFEIIEKHPRIQLNFVPSFLNKQELKALFRSGVFHYYNISRSIWNYICYLGDKELFL